MTKKTKITVVGSGYVGMSLSALLSQDNDVVVLDIDESRVSKINNKQSTIKDNEIELFLNQNDISLSATLIKEDAYKDSDFIIVATPTNYDVDNNKFDTSSVDKVVAEALDLNKEALIVIKSTIPIGHTKKLQDKFLTDRVVFSPEFLREGKALYDNLYPSRIIIGSRINSAEIFANKLAQSANKKNIEIIFMPSEEAEAVKLFANTYLAMRVAFFNELDSFALTNKLDTESIINGVSLDERIGKGYNNPSFGYGGYCLPKDTKQLLSNFREIPQTLISAIVSSNDKRKEFIANSILEKSPKSVGFYRLVMKEGSDNFRSSAIQGIIKIIEKKGIETFIYEPSINENSFNNSKVINDINKFKSISDVIVANRISDELKDQKKKVFTRDIFSID
jgi:UDPglucose 6-dehydrogenase